MDLVIPVKDPQLNRSKISEMMKVSENQNPNVKFSNSAASKSATKSQKLTSKNPNPIDFSPSPRNKIQERKFEAARNNSKREKPNSSKVQCKCKFTMSVNPQKCLCAAYQNRRASQEDIFKSPFNRDDQFDSESFNGANNGVEEIEEEEDKNANLMFQNPEIADEYEEQPKKFDCFVSNGLETCDPDEVEPSYEMGSSSIKRRRVFHPVEAFKRLLSMTKSKNSDQPDDNDLEDDKKITRWALTGLQQPKATETHIISSFGTSDFIVTSESLGLSSLDSGQGSLSISSRTSSGGQRSPRNSTELCGISDGSRWKRRKLKVTSQKPFKLRTEQRGRHKEEIFVKKVQQMMIEEEKQRISVAQGLPWTTDEPECLVIPPVKEITQPIDLVLHSNVRAVDRAEFDHQVVEKMGLIEQYKIERERQEKLVQENQSLHVPIFFSSQVFVPHFHLYSLRGESTLRRDFDLGHCHILGYSSDTGWMLLAALMDDVTQIGYYNIKTGDEKYLPHIDCLLNTKAIGFFSGILELETNVSLIVHFGEGDNVKIFKHYGAHCVWIEKTVKMTSRQDPVAHIKFGWGLFWIDRQRGKIHTITDWRRTNSRFKTRTYDSGGLFRDCEMISSLAIRGRLFFVKSQYDILYVHETVFKPGDLNFRRLQDLEGLAYFISWNGTGFALRPMCYEHKNCLYIARYDRWDIVKVKYKYGLLHLIDEAVENIKICPSLSRGLCQCRTAWFHHPWTFTACRPENQSLIHPSQEDYIFSFH